MNNGSLKSLLLLWENLANNHRYAGLVSERDIITFRTRSESEGLAFLTTVLPNLGKALDKFHSTTQWDSTDIGFKTDEDGIPHFLGQAIRFALEGSSVAVDCVRQLSYIFYKLEVPYPKSLQDDFLNRFIETDKEVGSVDLSLVEEHITRMRLLIGKILCDEDPTDIRPCHGTGATACRTPNWNKWHSFRYFAKLDHIFSYPDYFFYSYTHLSDEMEKLDTSNLGDPMARVCLVPKDSRGPRVISCEPKELMYIQQGLMRKLYALLETHPLCAGQINFLDQRVNQRMACIASITGEYATVDLKDASDRVSLQLVRKVFPSSWVEAFEACRSERTLLPDDRVVELNKFAPMGSSCCFPVEALVFWASARATLDKLGINNPVYVYGDDIIIASELFDAVVCAFEAIGLLTNRNKSFWCGPFRESCGGDYHNGFDVTPVRVRRVPSMSSTGLSGNADLANNFIAKFGYESSHSLIRVIEEAVGYTYPRTDMQIPCTIRANPCAVNDTLFRRRWNSNLQRYEYRILTLYCPSMMKQSPTWGELLRKELTREVLSLPDYSEIQRNLIESRMNPGEYVVPSTIRKTWKWTWLG